MFKKIKIIVIKEFKQIFRDKLMLGIIFGMPIIQLMILSYAINFEVSNVKIFINDLDKSDISSALISKLNSSQYFEIIGQGSYDQGISLIEKNSNEAIISIPENFGKNLLNPNLNSTIHVSVDAINGVKAGVSLNYANQILNDYTADILFENTGFKMNSPVQIKSRNWFNEELDYKILMVPGILVLLVTMVSMFLGAMNIVKEKEIGTIEQINVTPIAKHEFIIGKLLPFIFIGLIEFTIGLNIAHFWFEVPINGSLALIYLFTFIYLTLVLGIGMFISNFSDTQQQAMFIAWFFAVIFILMSGLFTPIESMPTWAQNITYFNPLRYYIEVLRLVLLKGSTIADVKFQLLGISTYSVLINLLAVYTYKKTNN